MDEIATSGSHIERDILLQVASRGGTETYDSDTESEESSLSKSLSAAEDLRLEIKKSFPECYKSDVSLSSESEITNDEELQASALCQFMDILNDLDDVLDKSLLARLDSKDDLDQDEDDVICKLSEKLQASGSGNNISTFSDETPSFSEDYPTSSMEDSMGNIINPLQAAENTSLQQATFERPRIQRLGRAKSFSALTSISRDVGQLVTTDSCVTDDGLRSSMRRLDPILLPAIHAPNLNEPLTLPVILFLNHHVNMRPTSAPIQLQVTAANLNGDIAARPLIVGRRTLLMNRALSLPSPEGSEGTAVEWGERTTARSTSGSSSSSNESLSTAVPALQPSTTTTEDRQEEAEDPPFGVWPHHLSSMLACLSCTVGIFNISRFAIFSVHFGANFIIQFIILSLIIGIPLFTLHLCLGQTLASGPMDMWRISPIFQGVGISLLTAQAVMGIYSIIGVSWIFVYFRDSFITSNDRYRWSMPLDLYGEDTTSVKLNSTFRIQETLPQYFHGEVLQRNLASNSSFGTIKFQVAFNLAVVWMIVFVALSKGLRSYGKAVYALMFLPICGTLVLCTKLLTLTPHDSVSNIFSETEWTEFFINSNSWAAAGQETFLTWGLLGACVMQLTSHKHGKNKTSRMLQKESATIVAFTLAILLLAAFLANTCVQILKNCGYQYLPGSYETVPSSQFLWPISEPLPGSLGSTPVRYMSHYGSLVGVTVWRVGSSPQQYSGWQPLQLATQLVPATLAALSTLELSPVWAVIFYFILIMFGIAQQLAIWHCVITGIMAINAKALRVWETTITFLSCVFGLLVGLLLTTDAGVRVVHFVDYVWVGAWWHCLLQVALLCGVFVVRGRPYSGDVVVAALYRSRTRCSATLASLLSFTWNIILPVVMIALCVVDFRTGKQRQLYSWRRAIGYWPIWSRQVAVVIQQATLLTVPVAAFAQTWRYMSKGPPDILERIQNLYRPRMGEEREERPPAAAPRAGAGGNAVVVGAGAPPAPPDPPPKYTPPPSYSTATGARLLNTLRRSFRTLRRLTTSLGDNEPRNSTTHMPITLSESVDSERPSLQSQPPEYSGVCAAPSLVLTDETGTSVPVLLTNIQRPPRVRNHSDSERPQSSAARNSLTLTRDFLRRSFTGKSGTSKNIRSSLRRSFKYHSALTTSNEQLVRDVEPMSNTVAMSAVLHAPSPTNMPL